MKRVARFIAKEVLSYFVVAVILYTVGVVSWHYIHMLTDWDRSEVLRLLGMLLLAYTLGVYAGKLNDFIWARFKRKVKP